MMATLIEGTNTCSMFLGFFYAHCMAYGEDPLRQERDPPHEYIHRLKQHPLPGTDEECNSGSE
jgi:hypothetical protein